MDDTWVHHHTPKSKQQSKQWKRPGSPVPKKVKHVLSANKVTEIILIDFLTKGQVLNVYARKLKYRGQECCNEKCCFTRIMRALASMAEIHSRGFELLPHPHYLSDLFKNLKNILRRSAIFFR